MAEAARQTSGGLRLAASGGLGPAGEPFDLIVVGGGPAGLAAAVAALESGLTRVLLLEREDFLGGVLPQCVHDGFGLHLHGVSYTGPEYAQLWRERAEALGAVAVTGTTVLAIAGPREDRLLVVEAVGTRLGGRATLLSRSVVVATGCRERTRGQLGVPGTRPAGVLTAGTAQYMVNVKNQLPGDKVVVLGSGDIGLIMARRFKLEGADVRLVLGEEATGLLRNHIRCVRDFDIPIRYGWGVAYIHGYGRLKGVTVAPMDSSGGFDMTRRVYVRCNVLLIATGLIPEREILAGCSAGPSEGLFVCGNASSPHDLVDQVTQESLAAGRRAAEMVCAAAGTQPQSLSEQTLSLLEMTVTEPKGRADAGMPAGFEWAADAIVCTACPTGCIMRVDERGRVSGNACKLGRQFARAESSNPVRLFTGTVRVEGADARLLPVKTTAEVPRAKLMDVARACRRIHVQAPVALGQVVRTDIAGTGADLVATQTIGSALGLSGSGF